MARALGDIAQEYVGRVDGLFRPPAERTDRAAASVLPAPQLEANASQLLMVSEEFNITAAADLRSGEPAVREQAALRLLAKARTDFELARLLVETDRDAEAARAAGAELPRAPDRALPPDALLGGLSDIVSPQAAPAEDRDSRTAAVGSAGDEKSGLVTAVGVSLRAIADGAAGAGRQAMKGVAAQGFAEVGKVAGRLGIAAADLIGVGDGVRWLLRLAQRFVARAYEAVLSLFGEGVVQAVSRKLADWLGHLVGDGFRGFVRDSLYGVSATAAALTATINASGAPAATLATVHTAVNALDPAFQAHTRLAKKFLDGLDDYAGWVTMVLNDLRLAVAVTYALLGGYVLLTGADYADASDWRLLDRIAGVRRTVENGLRQGATT